MPAAGTYDICWVGLVYGKSIGTVPALSPPPRQASNNSYALCATFQHRATYHLPGLIPPTLPQPA